VAANTKESQVNATVEDAPVITKDETAQPSA